MSDHKIERLNKARKLIETALADTSLNPILREMYETKQHAISRRLLELTALPIVRKELSVSEDKEKKRKKKKRSEYSMAAALYWGIPHVTPCPPDEPPAPAPIQDTPPMA